MVVCSRCELLKACFFFNDTATTEIYTLSLHDALPICHTARRQLAAHHVERLAAPARHFVRRVHVGKARRSEEHTSELQSQSNIVCRLLLEKKKSASDIVADCVLAGAI